MALNWADSSDEEDEAFFAAEHNPPVPGAEEEEEHEPSLAGDEEPPPKQFVLPDRPPYTAFVGNLAFSVTEPDQLGQDIAGLVQQRFQSDIVITASRVATDRQTGKPKGFGYVEVETVEQVSVAM
jgi:RNA recognition motif-containing protein